MERELDRPVRIASNLEDASAELKASTFSAVLLDQSLYEALPLQIDSVLQHLGSAAPIIVNFAISNLDRVVRTVRIALAQRRREIQMARLEACAKLRNELNDDLSALILVCETGLQDPTLNPQTVEQMKHIDEIGKNIRQKLEAEKREIAAAACA
jgi:hypothetical protein